MSKVGAAILHALAAALGRGRCALCGKCVYDEARSDARDPEASSKGQVTCNANDLMDTSNSIYQSPRELCQRAAEVDQPLSGPRPQLSTCYSQNGRSLPAIEGSH